ncbi:MAG: hypothetical protein H7Y00_15885 [Fimbriimonadaceae bacterium]|nr:hypothetical protein [Chitinophagales bacterium]
MHSKILKLLEKSWSSHTNDSANAGLIIKDLEILANKSVNNNFIALSKIEKANYLTNYNGNYHEALKLLEEADALLDAEYKKQYAGYYHLSTGKNYHQLAANEKAQHHYHTAIKALEAKIEKAEYEKKWLGMSYYNLYTLFSYTDPEFSQYEFLQKALDVYREIDYKTGLSNCYNSMARIYFNKEDYKTAIDYLLTSKNILEESGDTTILPTLYSNIGLTYAKINHTEEGIAYVEKGIALATKQKSNLRIVHAYEKLGEIYLLSGQYKKALDNLKIAEKKALAIQAKKYLSGIYKNMVEVYEKMEDYKYAHEYDLKYIEIILENFKEEKTQAILKARNQFELEKKELETILLKEKNKQIENYALKLKAYNDELSQFTYVTSHHLREPLRTITSYVAMLERSLKDKVDADEKEFMQYITGATATMYNLLGGLITFSNIDIVKTNDTADLHSVLDEIKNELEDELQKKNALIEYKNLPVINGSTLHFKNLFRNLILNAITFNKNKQPKGIIIYKQETANHHFIISDNGIGIDTEYQYKIFMIFERLHTKSEYPGTGIGLAICKKIVEQMHGKIWVEKNASGGSDFHVLLPDK